MPRQRKTRPQNIGQNRNVQMRNNARRPNPFGQQTFNGGLSQQGKAGRGPTDMNCPTGQKPVKGPDGKMTCQRVGPPKPKSNTGAY